MVVTDDDFRKVEDDDFESYISKCSKWEKEHLKEVYKLVYNVQDDYIILPNNDEIKDSNIMEEFIENIENKNIKKQLENCMWQRGMYRKFKDKLLQLGLEEKYYEFYNAKLKEIAISWCNKNNLKYEE